MQIGLRSVFVVLLFAFSLVTAHADTRSGYIQLKPAGNGEVEQKAHRVSLGGKVKAECRYYIIPDFFGKQAVSVQATVRNTARTTMYYGYYVAFYDKKGNLIACSSFGGMSGDISRLKPGEQSMIGNVLSLPRAEIARIAAYQVTVLEDTKPFG